ncbi:MAG: hypothetical protein WKF73_07375 [Nocardioidaceae bacterium]
MHNLDSKDYGRPLDELRDLFWSSPRMPLLPAGEADLQRAIYEAVATGQLRLVGADDLDRTVTRPGDIAVGSSGLRLAPPKTAELAADTTAPTVTAPGPHGAKARSHHRVVTRTAVRAARRARDHLQPDN